MDDTRNKMTTADVNADTLFDIEFTHKVGRWGTRDTYRPTAAYVVAIKPCGCTGPHLGNIETVQLPKAEHRSAYDVPRAFNPAEIGYDLKIEAKGRVGLYLNSERLFGKLIYGLTDTSKLFRQLAYGHYIRTVLEAGRPNYPDARMHTTVKDAMTRRPRLQCKLWAVRPDKPYRYGSKAKPVGYVWGKEAAANALHHWWVEKNLAAAPKVVAA
jgi:hypothetical protein